MLRTRSLLCIALALGLPLSAAVAQEAAPELGLPDAARPFQSPDLARPIDPLKGLAPLQMPETTAAPAAAQSGSLVRLAAHLIDGGQEIKSGMTWRVFSPSPGTNGRLPLVATLNGGVSELRLQPGSYLVHAAYGRAGATKRITVGDGPKDESVVLDAGGLKLNALLAGGASIPGAKLRFSIYEDKADAAGNRALIVPDVKPDAIVRLNSGVYHVVSNYGSVNSVVRSDIRVEAGKLTEATVEHKAAQVTLKLVREAGGEALAETSWSIVNDAGDPITETVGPYATLILSEGTYTVSAKNRDQIFQRELVVQSGRDSEVEVIANAETEVDPNEGAD